MNYGPVSNRGESNMKRRRTTELQAIVDHERILVPPPSMVGTSLREWFAGLAIGNAALMDGIDDDYKIIEAIRIADELVKALAAPKTPTLESMAAPTEEEMKVWDEATAIKNDEKVRQSRATIPELRANRVQPPRSVTLTGVAVPSNPPPGYQPVDSQRAADRVPSIPPPSIKSSRLDQNAGRYVVVMNPTIRLKGRQS